tara:strand:- start:28 stop:216 length:189 start_codon:yes stop_codon:yes gene_type:complete
MTEKQLKAFKDGTANGLLKGVVDEVIKNKHCRHSYQQGYDFGLYLYAEQDPNENEQASKQKG